MYFDKAVFQLHHASFYLKGLDVFTELRSGRPKNVSNYFARNFDGFTRFPVAQLAECICFFHPTWFVFDTGSNSIDCRQID